MINKRLIWTVIFNRVVHPCVYIDVLPGVRVEEFIGVRGGMVIDTTLPSVYVDVTLGIVSDIGVEVLTDVNAIVLVVAMTSL